MSTEGDASTTSVLGACGKFQVFVTLSAIACTSVSVWSLMFMTFASYNPGWMCLDDNSEILTQSDFSNTTNSSLQQNMSYSFLQSIYSGDRNSSNRTSNEVVWTTDCRVKQNCSHKVIFNGESRTVVTEWDLTCERSWILSSMMVSLPTGGSLLGCFSAGQLGDLFGRKTSIYAHLVIQFVMNFVSIFSVSWQMYAVLSFINGFGAGGVLCTIFPFPLEFVNSWWRGAIVTVPMWGIGYVPFTIMASVLRDWQHMHIATLVLCGCVLVTIFFTPESVRWLATHQKVNKAKRLVRKIARINGIDNPDITFVDNIADEVTERTDNDNHSFYSDLISQPTLRSNLLKFSFIWITLPCFFFGVSFAVDSLFGDFYINLLASSFIEIPSQLVVGPLANTFGRRKSSFGLFVVEVLCCGLLVVFSVTGKGGDEAGLPVTVLALTSKAIIVAAWGVVDVYSNETFPTVLRIRCYGILMALSRVAAMIAPFTFPTNSSDLYFTFSGLGLMSVVCCVLILTLKDTHGDELANTVVVKQETDTSLITNAQLTERL